MYYITIRKRIGTLVNRLFMMSRITHSRKEHYLHLLSKCTSNISLMKLEVKILAHMEDTCPYDRTYSEGAIKLPPVYPAILQLL